MKRMLFETYRPSNHLSLFRWGSGLLQQPKGTKGGPYTTHSVNQIEQADIGATHESRRRRRFTI